MLDMTAMTEGPSSRGRVAADSLAIRLIAIRHEQGKVTKGKTLSQREAAEMTGVPYGTWQGMEDGRATRDLDKHVAKICDTFGYDRGWLMWGTQPSPQPGGGPDGGHPADPGALDELTKAKRRRHARVSHTRGYPIAA